EMEATVPSAHAAVQRCQHVWRMAHRTLFYSRDVYSCTTNCCLIPAPAYQKGQRVWLSSRFVPTYRLPPPTDSLMGTQFALLRCPPVLSRMKPPSIHISGASCRRNPAFLSQAKSLRT
ncbi:hypothetical protein XENOCAPTIV_001219, partial [Xenoophorus captivus]